MLGTGAPNAGSGGYEPAELESEFLKSSFPIGCDVSLGYGSESSLI